MGSVQVPSRFWCCSYTMEENINLSLKFLIQLFACEFSKLVSVFQPQEKPEEVLDLISTFLSLSWEEITSDFVLKKSYHMMSLMRVSGAVGKILEWSPACHRAPTLWTHTLTPRFCLFLIWGRKLEHRGRAHAGTGEAAHSAENELTRFFFKICSVSEWTAAFPWTLSWSRGLLWKTEMTFPQNCWRY